MKNLFQETNDSIVESIMDGQRAPRGFFMDKSNRISLIQKFIEKCGEKADYDDAKKHNILGMLNRYYGGSLSEALAEIKERKSKEEIFDAFFDGEKIPYNFFESKENRIYFIKGFMDKIGKNPATVKAHDFKNSKLWNLLNYHYKASTKKMIEEVYPEFETFRLPRLPKSFWEDKEQRIKAVQYTVDEVLSLLSDDDIKALSFKKLQKAGLSSSLISYYKENDGFEQMLKEAYPNIVQ